MKHTFIVTGNFNDGSDISAGAIEGIIERTLVDPHSVNINVTEADKQAVRYIEHGAEVDQRLFDIHDLLMLDPPHTGDAISILRELLIKMEGK